MKKILSLLISLLIFCINTGVVYALEVPAGTTVPVMLNNSINSDSLSDGDVVSIRVTEDVYIGKQKVFAKDTQGVAYVAKAEHTSHHGGAGMIAIKDGKIMDVNNKKHNVQIAISTKGKSKRPSSIFLSIIGVLIILIPFGCWRYGEPATVSQSQVFNSIVPAEFDL